MGKFTIGFCMVFGVSLLLIALPAVINGHWVGYAIMLLACLHLGWAIWSIVTFKRLHAPRRRQNTSTD
jgi:cytochrome b